MSTTPITPAQVEALAATMTALSLPGDIRARVLRVINGTSESSERLLTTRQAAAVLEHRPMTLVKFGRMGVLHPVRRSKRCLRWRESEVRRFAAEGVAP